MKRAMVNHVLGKIGKAIIDIPFSRREIPICPEKRLMCTLWWLGKGDVLLSVLDKFNITLSAVHKNTQIVLDGLLSLLHLYCKVHSK